MGFDLKEPTCTEPSLAKLSTKDGDAYQTLIQSSRGSQGCGMPPVKSDLHYEKSLLPAHGWTGILCLPCIVCSDEDLFDINE